MVLNIVIRKTDYTPHQLESLATLMIKNCDIFIDGGRGNGNGDTLTASFGGSGLTRVSRIIRGIKAIKNKVI